MKCDRCGKAADVTTMSYFNTDTICMTCQRKEQAHPAYAQAKKIENAQVRAGNYNYPGIGKPDDL